MNTSVTDVGRIALPVPTAGAVVEGVACLRAKQPKQDRNGGTYLVVDIGHREGSARLKIWASDAPQWAELNDGDALCLSLLGKPARGDWPPEWSVRSVQKLPADHPIRDDLLPACPIHEDELARRWADLCAQLSHPARALLDVVLQHVGEDRYRRAAAAERMHHAVAPHGLWWHSIEVGEAALALARSIPTYEAALSVDVLILGALLHDVGKVLEYAVLPGVGIRRASIANGRYHTTLGIQLVTEAVTLARPALKAARTPGWLIDAVRQVIESHHALKDWGSPSAPASREAWLLHLADMASAKLNALSDDVATATLLDDDGWCRPTDTRHPPLQRFDLLTAALQNDPQAGAGPRTAAPTAVASDGACLPLHVDPLTMVPPAAGRVAREDTNDDATAANPGPRAPATPGTITSVTADAMDAWDEEPAWLRDPQVIEVIVLDPERS